MADDLADLIWMRCPQTSCGDPWAQDRSVHDIVGYYDPDVVDVSVAFFRLRSSEEGGKSIPPRDVMLAKQNTTPMRLN